LFQSKTFAQDTITVNRLWGKDRFETSLEILKSGWTSSDTIILATGNDFPDALCAAPLAKKYNAPILLTDGQHLSDNALTYLKSMNAKNAVIIGGPLVITSKVEDELKSLNISNRRIYGQDRFETSLKILEDLGINDEAFVVSGDNFPDSLSISSLAAKKQAPILLVSQSNEQKNSTVVNLLKDKQNIKTYVVGGEGIISNGLVSSFPNSERVAGKDRYETNIAVLKRFTEDFDFAKLYISTGGNFPDAISGSRLASLTNSPIMFTTRKPTDAIKQLFNDKKASVSNISVLGGDAVVRDYTINNLLYNTEITQNEPEPMTDEEIAAELKNQLAAKYASLKSKVTSYLNSQSGSYGFYFINLVNGTIIDYNANTIYTGASTVKVPINLYVYELRRRGTISGDTKYQYLSSDYETGTGSLQYSKPGGYYTVKDLSNKSIRISDNVAANILLRNVAGQGFYDYLGNIIGHSVVPWKNAWSPKDMALFMKATYNFNSANPSLGSEFLGNLENTIFNDRINRYLTGVTVAHKIGNQTRVMNDVGIVYAKQPYIVAFMSSNVYASTACTVIGQASKMIYDFVQSN
jgi:putative cell wall-binding protein/beta-lactamase class A